MRQRTRLHFDSPREGERVTAPTNRYAIAFIIHCDIAFKSALLPELEVESAEGTSPSTPPRTVRESLDSYGSYRLAHA